MEQNLRGVSLVRIYQLSSSNHYWDDAIITVLFHNICKQQSYVPGDVVNKSEHMTYVSTRKSKSDQQLNSLLLIVIFSPLGFNSKFLLTVLCYKLLILELIEIYFQGRSRIKWFILHLFALRNFFSTLMLFLVYTLPLYLCQMCHLLVLWIAWYSHEDNTLVIHSPEMFMFS